MGPRALILRTPACTGSPPHLCERLERGRSCPSLRTLFRLAAVLDIRPSELVRLVEVEVGP